MSASRHTESPDFGAVVVVASQGGLHASKQVLSRLPVGFGVPVLLDLHRPPGATHVGYLLGSQVNLSVVAAADGQRLEPGHVYLAPGDRQLLVADEHSLAVREKADAREPGHASASPLLESAAEVFGRRLIAVVLTGRLDGGAEGVGAVKRAGGRVLVEDPRTAAAPSMPNASLATGCVDLALPAPTIGHAVTAFCSVPGAADLFRVRLNPFAIGRAGASADPVASAVAG